MHHATVYPYFIGLIFLTKGAWSACTYERTESKKGNQSKWKGYQIVEDVAACEDVCTGVTKCVAAEFVAKSNSCYSYYEVTLLQDDTDTVYLKQVCQEDTTQQTTTTASTTTGMSWTPSCFMTREPNLKGGATNLIFIARSKTMCSKACHYFRSCKASIFQGDRCNLYDSTTIPVSGRGNADFVKITSPNGDFMMTTSNLNANGILLLSSSSNSTTDCESICLAVWNCYGTYYDGGACYFYLVGMYTSYYYDDRIVSSYKSCPSGSRRASLFFESSYYNGSIQQRCSIPILVGLAIMWISSSTISL